MNAIDTNILIYAADNDDAIKGVRAVDLLDRLSKEPATTILPWQVVCEFTAFLSRIRQRKGPNAAAGAAEFQFVQSIAQRFRVVTPTPSVAGLAIDIHVAEQVSFWDSLLLAACVEAGVTTLYSEDMQSRPTIRGVTITNPFV